MTPTEIDALGTKLKKLVLSAMAKEKPPVPPDMQAAATGAIDLLLDAFKNLGRLADAAERTGRPITVDGIAAHVVVDKPEPGEDKDSVYWPNFDAPMPIESKHWAKLPRSIISACMTEASRNGPEAANRMLRDVMANSADLRPYIRPEPNR